MLLKLIKIGLCLSMGVDGKKKPKAEKIDIDLR